jgi:hypothetical protein
MDVFLISGRGRISLSLAVAFVVAVLAYPLTQYWGADSNSWLVKKVSFWSIVKQPFV